LREREVEAGPALVEEDEVLLGPVAAIGHDEIEVLVAIKVADPQGSGNVRFGPELESVAGDKAPLCGTLRSWKRLRG